VNGAAVEQLECQGVAARPPHKADCRVVALQRPLEERQRRITSGDGEGRARVPDADGLEKAVAISVALCCSEAVRSAGRPSNTVARVLRGGDGSVVSVGVGDSAGVHRTLMLRIPHDADSRYEARDEGRILCEGESDHLAGDFTQENAAGGVGSMRFWRVHCETADYLRRLRRLAEQILDG
jgi:hypothetical protein